MKAHSTVGAAIVACAVLLTSSFALAQDEPPPGAVAPDTGGSTDDFLVEGFEAPPDDLDPDAELTIDYFIDKLSPYGKWFWTEEYGWVWQPDGLTEDWKPFTYGHWVNSDYGWTWVWHFPWGWAAFHYGAWTHLEGVGWVWVPAGIWSPARVVWRYSEVYVGWSPIPAGYDYWVGWHDYPVHHVHWTFISWHFFGHLHPYHHFVHHHHAHWCFNHTHFPPSCGHHAGPACHYGPSPKKVTKLSGKPVKRRKIKSRGRLAKPGPKRNNAPGKHARKPRASKPRTSRPAARTPGTRPSKPVTIGRQHDAPRRRGSTTSRSKSPNRRQRGSVKRQHSSKPSVRSGSSHRPRSKPSTTRQRPSRSQPSRPSTRSSRPSSNSKSRSSGSKSRSSVKSSKSSKSSSSRSKSSRSKSSSRSSKSKRRR
ncbi:MAG: hypothetical protein JRF63_04740 [Deltaproteobacteria bacterium]|nr:hypothetical protein [Deltaproteobacteria bacterium]